MKDILETKETILLLGCHASRVSGYLKNGKLELSKKQHADKRKKFFTKASVEKLKAELDTKKSNSQILNKKLSEQKLKKQNKKVNNNHSFTLSSLGKQVMSDAIDELKSLGIYRKHDNYAILDYAIFYQIAMEETSVGAKSTTYLDDKGVQRINKSLEISITMSKILDSKRKNLGLDPISRAKLPVKEKRELDEMSALING